MTARLWHRECVGRALLTASIEENDGEVAEGLRPSGLMMETATEQSRHNEQKGLI